MENEEIIKLAKELAMKSIKALLMWAISIFGAACLALLIFYFRTTAAIPALDKRVEKIENTYVTRTEIKASNDMILYQLNNLQTQNSSIYNILIKK